MRRRNGSGDLPVAGSPVLEQFDFAGTAGQFSGATEECLLLRHLDSRRGNWMLGGVMAGAFLLAASICTVLQWGEADIWMLDGLALLVTLSLLGIAAWDDWRGGEELPMMLETLYPIGAPVPTAEKAARAFRVCVEGDRWTFFDAGEPVATWDVPRWRRASESNEIFLLYQADRRAGNCIALPKIWMTEETERAFRGYISRRLGRRKIRFYTVSPHLRDCLERERRKLQKKTARYQAKRVQ